jgi:uncharacterized membrane protein YuzA (DUF378 family)
MKRGLTLLAFILVIIGAINWLLVGIFSFDIVAWMFTTNTAAMSRIIYIIIGIAGLWVLSHLLMNSKAEEAK